MALSPERFTQTPVAQRRIYFDHAATSWPKLPAAVEAAFKFVQECGATTGRGTYSSAQTAQNWLSEARLAVSKLVNSNPNCIAFCTSGTHALNAALCGWLQPGDHIVTTAIEHNSLLRPLASIARRTCSDVVSQLVLPAASGVAEDLIDVVNNCDEAHFEESKVDTSESELITLSIAPCDERGLVSADAIAALVRPNTKLIAVGHASNVTGTVQPLQAISQIAAKHSARLLVDASQTLGYLPIDMKLLKIDLLAAAGHKGLRAMPGTGILAVTPEMRAQLQPLLTGGTGIASEQIDIPPTWPMNVEVGNLNLPAIVSLAIAAQQADTTRPWLISLKRLHGGLLQLPGVTVYGIENTSEVGVRTIPVISITVEGWDIHDLANVLDANYGIETRAGLHCAAKIHEHIGTVATGGTLRMSLGHGTTFDEVEVVLRALNEILSV